MSQTSYQQDPNPAVEGMLADTSLDKEIRSAIADEDITFGRWVARTSGDETPRAVLPTTAGEIAWDVGLGIALSDVTLEGPAAGATALGWATDSVLRYLRHGHVWVLAEVAVAYGDPVFVRHVAAGGEELGRFRNDADAGDATQLPGAFFRRVTSGADELTIIEVSPQT